MPCYAPLQGWRSRTRNASGKRGITFDFHEGYADQPLEVPCGQCIGCKITRSRQWALRCVHEASLHDANSFLTLTYDDAHLPGQLEKRDLQLFLKRLRERIGKFRYFAIGEYGEHFSRPHYHALIFGYDFPDKTYWAGSGIGRLCRSDELEKCWEEGHALVGTVTPASAQYVSKYCTKIVKGPEAKQHYGGKKKEFAIMSRRPGIGKGWIDQFQDSIFPRDFVVVEGGAKVAPPRYYTDQQDPHLRARLKHARLLRMKDDPDARGSRRAVKAELAEINLARAERKLER